MTKREKDLKAWLRAAVSENRRLRKAEKAWRETQDELVEQINQLSKEVQLLAAIQNRREGTQDRAGDAIACEDTQTDAVDLTGLEGTFPAVIEILWESGYSRQVIHTRLRVIGPYALQIQLNTPKN